MANYLNRHDHNIHLIFQNLCPVEHQDLLFKWFQGENECSLGLPTMTTNSFENPITKNLKIFFHFFALTLRSWHLFPFFEISAKFIMTKGVQNKFIYFMQMMASKKCLHFSKNTFITKTAPSWSFILMLLVTVDKSSEFR